MLTGQVTYRMTQPITAWLSIGSTYTYLTALRINAVQREMDLTFSVKPISIRAIMKSVNNIPFPSSNKAKVNYIGRASDDSCVCWWLSSKKLRLSWVGKAVPPLKGIAKLTCAR